MLGDQEAMATIAVKDMNAARPFYEEKLGLQPDGTQEPGVVVYRSGNGKVLVYESQYARTNKATSATWSVDGVEGLARELKAKGVTFEHYDDLPGVTRDGDIHHIGGGMKGAWFKDPDGNILHIVGK